MTTEFRKLATFMFTDMVGYSALTQKNEALAVEMLAEHRQLLRTIFARHAGLELDAVGDGFLVEFASAVDAARCAVDIQQALGSRNAAVVADRRIHVRIGLHLGDVVVRDGRAYGDGVNIAARIEPLAAAGGICLSEDVARQIQNRIELPIRRLGRGELKNIQLPVDIYRLVLPGERQHLPLTERLSFSLRRRRTRLFAWLLALAVLVGIGFYLGQRTLSGPEVSNNRIAVLPFINISADPNDEYFADGMTEELISRLSKISGLEIIARTSVMKYKGTGKNVADIGRELNVGTVLEGSVRKAEKGLRITAKLVNVRNQAHLWSENYDRKLEDVFAIQSDIAQRVAEALSVRLLSVERQRVVKKGTENLDAYTAYLKGRYFWNKRSPEGLKKAVGYFQQAIDSDPGYALAYAGLADSYNVFYWYMNTPPKETFPKGKAAALKALELDDTLAEAHTALALVRLYYDWDWPEAEQAFKQAIALNPSYATAHQWYSDYLKATGRLPEAVAEIRRAQELDPLSLIIHSNVGWTYYLARQYDLAIEQLRQTLEMSPDFFRGHWLLAQAYLQKGMYEEAITELRRAVEVSGGYPEAVGGLGYAYGMAGRSVEAKKLLGELKGKTQKEYIPPLTFPRVYIGLGDNDQAFVWLQKAYEERSADLVYLRVEPVYDRLRSDPRFIGLERKVGLVR